MKIKPIGSNQTELHKVDGTIVLFSYERPVACFKPAQGWFKTDTYYSKTTTKHINQWHIGSIAKVKPQSFFDELV